MLFFSTVLFNTDSCLRLDQLLPHGVKSNHTASAPSDWTTSLVIKPASSLSLFNFLCLSLAGSPFQLPFPPPPHTHTLWHTHACTHTLPPPPPPPVLPNWITSYGCSWIPPLMMMSSSSHLRGTTYLPNINMILIGWSLISSRLNMKNYLRHITISALLD